MESIITTFGWVALGLSFFGIVASSLAIAHYMGYKKGGGEWRGTDILAPAPTVRRYDADILAEVKVLREKLATERKENMRLRKVTEKQYSEIHNGKQMPTPRKRQPKLQTTNIYVP